MKKKILLADDDKNVSEIYEKILTEAGLEVTVAYDGEEAMKRMKSESPDMILLDLLMPEKNGFQVLEEKANDDDLKQIPVIILTNLVQEQDVERLKKLGVVDYLTKLDFSTQEVVGRIKRHLQI